MISGPDGSDSRKQCAVVKHSGGVDASVVTEASNFAYNL